VQGQLYFCIEFVCGLEFIISNLHSGAGAQAKAVEISDRLEYAAGCLCCFFKRTVHRARDESCGGWGISGTRRNVWAKWGEATTGRLAWLGLFVRSGEDDSAWAGPAAAARPRRGRASARYPSLLLLHEHDRSTETVLSAAPARCYSYLQAQPTHHPCCGQQDCDWRRPDGRQRRGNGKSATDRCELTWVCRGDSGRRVTGRRGVVVLVHG
jgi:hypothetical protein